jgi:hypothetical protein
LVDVLDSLWTDTSMSLTILVFVAVGMIIIALIRAAARGRWP